MPYPIYQNNALLGGGSIEAIVGYADDPFETCSRLGHSIGSFPSSLDYNKYSCNRCGRSFDSFELQAEFARMEKLAHP